MNNEMEMLKMYNEVFKDFVNCRIEDKNYDIEEYEIEKIELTENEIKEIVDRLIFKSEYMWEIINDTIDIEIERIIEKR